MKQRGWVNIGYQYGIELVNYDYEILVGRFESETGAHTIGQNKNSIGICVVGDFDKIEVPKRQWQPALNLVRDILMRYKLAPGDVYGHRDFTNKSCPGKRFSMELFRSEL
jgi:N-acetylmuramoyl-L-alanine amidase